MNKEAEFLVKVAYLRGQADAQDDLYRKGYIKEAANWWPKLQSSLKSLLSKSAPEGVNMMRKGIGEDPIVNPIASGVRKILNSMKENAVPIGATLGGAGLGALGGGALGIRHSFNSLEEENPEMTPYLDQLRGMTGDELANALQSSSVGGFDTSDDVRRALYGSVGMPDKYIEEINKDNSGTLGSILGGVGGAGLGLGGAALLKKLLSR
jgi:hypothetical protein